VCVRARALSLSYFGEKEAGEAAAFATLEEAQKQSRARALW